MLDDEKIKSFLLDNECSDDVEKVYQKFPNIRRDVLIYHIKKYRNDLYSDSGNDENDKSKRDETTMVRPAKQREGVKQWILENYASNNRLLYEQFSSLKDVTLRGYRKEVADFLYKELSYSFLFNNDDWPSDNKKLDEFFIYILRHPSATELSLRKKFTEIDIAVIRDFKQRVLSAIENYRKGEDMQYNNAQSINDDADITDNSNDNIRQNAASSTNDNADNLDLESLEKKASQTEQSHKTDTTTENQLNKIKSLEKRVDLLKKHIASVEKQIPALVKTAVEQVLLEKLTGIGLGIVGKMIEKHIGSLGKINFNIDMGLGNNS